MLTFHSPKHSLRDAATELSGGELVAPFECPARAQYVLQRAQEVGLGEVREPDQHGLQPVLRVHDPRFVEFLRDCWAQWQAAGFEGEAIPTVWPSRHLWTARIPEFIEGRIGYYALTAETSISDGTYEAARAAADVALSAQAAIAAGAGAAFALCRPPGHHAAGDAFGGYCFLNNAAIAAQACIDQGASRVAIIDTDFHHGNGTQSIFYQRPDVLFISLHGDPSHAFPHFLGYADERGAGAGSDANYNYPLPPDTDYAHWSAALLDACRRVRAFAPDALVVSLGVDTFAHDPISFFRLESDDFTRYGALLAGLRLPTLFVMEGGYAVAEIGVNMVNVLSGFEAGAC